MRRKNIHFVAGRPWPTLLRFALPALMALALAAPGWAQTSHHPKIAPDFASAPVNKDGTIDVIVQFTEKPQAQHFQMMSAHGGQLKHAFQHVKGAAYRIPAAMLPFLENQPDVAYVTPDRTNKSSDGIYPDNTSAVMLNAARSQYGSGLNGAGVSVAIIDSGIYSSHPDLQNWSGTVSRVVYSQSFVSGDSTTNDAYGHGTHVAGIVGGNGAASQNGSGYPATYQGFAPSVNLINLRVLDQNGSGTDSQVIAAIDEAIQLQSTYNIGVINLSLGRPVYESYTQDPLCQAVEAAWQAGIVVVVAAGNYGRDNTYSESGYGTITAPGNDPYVITVGGTNTEKTTTRTDDTISSYSSKGPTLLDHVVKPDLVAPGNQIASLLSPGSTIPAEYSSFVVSPPGSSQAEYMILSGTSMATPVVSGAAALLIQQTPGISPDTVKARMMKTAWKGYPTTSWSYDMLGNSYFSQYDVFTIGAGYLDIDAALGSTDVTNGYGAISPTAMLNSSTGQVSFQNNTATIYGNSILWGSSIVWGESIVWGSGVVSGQSIVWGASGAVWGNNTSVTATSVIWGSSIVWGVTGEGESPMNFGNLGDND
jgi:serine protease AprX